jgi:asparagine synthase (glutamine-hydrolysing)
MCGIAGIFHPSVPKPVDPARVAAMCDRLAHRGPDGSGVWTAPGVGLGHRRLSIIDLEGGVQPMLTPDERFAVTYNGEVYNFLEVRAELEAKGAVFRTHSDTEVILAAWRQWGPDCLSRFNGMFVFALYDAANDTLFLARDRMGVKPLFHAELSDGAFIFASELKGLLAHPCSEALLIPRRSRIISPTAMCRTTHRSSQASASSRPAISWSSSAGGRCRGRCGGGTSTSPTPPAARQRRSARN